MLLGGLAAAAPSAGLQLSVGYLREVDGSPAAEGLRRLGVEPELVPTRRMLDPSGLLRLRRHLAAIRPDIVHTHLAHADLMGTLAARSLGLPSVSTFHMIARHPAGQPRAARRRTALKGDLSGFVRRRWASRVIAVSDAARDAYLATGWDKPAHVVTVHNGIVAPGDDPAAGARVRAELGIGPDELVVSTVTVLRRDKGHDVAVEAVRRLLPRFPQLRLVIMGDGPARGEIRQMAEAIGPAAVLTGHRDDVMAVLRATDVLLHPTSMDAFPTALLEAAAARVPVLATAVGGIPEIVEDGVTGFLQPPPPQADVVADHLAALLGDPALREEMGRRAAERFAADFTADLWAQRLRRVYDDALGVQRQEAGQPPLTVDVDSLPTQS